jgi:N-acetylneuraminic acid mutarotase
MKGLLMVMSITAMAGAADIRWRDLPPLPQSLGGQFVGTVGERLVVAGGSHWDGVPRPWNGGKKVFSDAIYVLERGATAWKKGGTLPVALGYGVSISLSDAMLCIGGQTPTANTSQVYRLRWVKGTIAIDTLPDLPATASNTAGAVSGNTIYVAAGQSTPSSLKALDVFWALSLKHPEEGWKTLPSWPGLPRFMPMAAAARDAFYLVGGAEFTGTPGPPVGRRFLKDAYRYRSGRDWDRLPDLPAKSQAGYAVMDGPDLIVMGGNDGEYADREFEMKDNHPGFPLEIYRLKPGAKTWESSGKLPSSLVTSGLVRWGDEVVIAGGEDKPGHRSGRVVAGTFIH